VGANLPKIFLPLGNEPMLALTLKVFLAVPEISGIVVVVPGAEEAKARQLCAALPQSGRIRAVVPGGARRQDSVQAGLDQLDARTEVVLVHDAARPFVSPALIRRVLAAAVADGAAVPGMPVTDTLKQLDGSQRVLATVDRRQLAAVQTPQGFRTAVLRQAYAESWAKKLTATDDAGLVEQLGLPVTVVPGEAANFKITTAHDLRLAELWLRGEAGC
jgi:2-C-methyl-D-erythritol 4-phosphate cytidylyltransferase